MPQLDPGVVAPGLVGVLAVAGIQGVDRDDQVRPAARGAQPPGAVPPGRPVPGTQPFLVARRLPDDFARERPLPRATVQPGASGQVVEEQRLGS